jgi:hypothetical protein
MVWGLFDLFSCSMGSEQDRRKREGFNWSILEMFPVKKWFRIYLNNLTDFKTEWNIFSSIRKNARSGTPKKFPEMQVCAIAPDNVNSLCAHHLTRVPCQSASF